jgi:hypothetical protein
MLFAGASGKPQPKECDKERCQINKHMAGIRKQG